MIPVVTPSEMAKIDTEAGEPINVLIERAGNAIAWRRKIFKGTYGKKGDSYRWKEITEPMALKQQSACRDGGEGQYYSS